MPPQNPPSAVPTAAERFLASQLKKQASEIKSQGQILEELKTLMQTAADAPKWIEDIPGKRVPYVAQVDITVPAGSTARLEGTYPIPQDGAFVNTGVAMFWRRTSGAYTGMWMPATTYDLKMADSSQQLGYGGLFDNPCVASFNVELSDSGSDREWQNVAFASALFNPQSGGIYMWPAAYLFDTNSVARVRVTPTIAPLVAGVCAVLLLGYKIVQGVAYQP